MEEQAIHQTHHQETHQEVGNSIYLVLGLILVTPLLAVEFGSKDLVMQWHPLYHIGNINAKGYHLWWYLTLLYLTMKSVLWSIVAILKEPKHIKMIFNFLIYETIMLMDFIIIYGRSPVRGSVAIIFSAYMVYYHYKYEPRG